MVYSLPFEVCNKIHRFYLSCEKNLAIMDDENAAKQSLEHQVE